MSDIVVIVQRRPTADEYKIFREGAGWRSVEESLADRALANSVFCLVAEVEGKAVGMARVISEGGKYFDVHDVIVLPSFRRRGLATSLMKRIVEVFGRAATPSSNAVLSLVAEPRLAVLYTRLGFEPDAEMASMFRLWLSRAAQFSADDADGVSNWFAALIAWNLLPTLTMTTLMTVSTDDRVPALQAA